MLQAGILKPKKKNKNKMIKWIWSDAFPLSSVDYEFIIQYCDTKPKTDILKKLRNKYPMTNSHFYKIWREEKVHMVEWY